MNLKTDGAYYIGEYEDLIGPERIFFDFETCASYSAYDFINVYDDEGHHIGYLELIGGDYE